MAALLSGAENADYTQMIQKLEDTFANCEDPMEQSDLVWKGFEVVFDEMARQATAVFNQLDVNGDGVADRAELRAKAEQSEEFAQLLDS